MTSPASGSSLRDHFMLFARMTLPLASSPNDDLQRIFVPLIRFSCATTPVSNVRHKVQWDHGPQRDSLFLVIQNDRTLIGHDTFQSHLMMKVIARAETLVCTSEAPLMLVVGKPLMGCRSRVTLENYRHGCESMP